jgi:hypothetical protein
MIFVGAITVASNTIYFNSRSIDFSLATSRVGLN